MAVAIALAQAGLQRLGIMPNETSIQFEGNEFSVSVLDADVFVPAGGQGIIAIQVRAEDQQLVRRSVEQLPLELREVLVLRELEGLSYKEIAAIAGIPMGTVMSRLAQARERLHPRLGGCGDWGS